MLPTNLVTGGSNLNPLGSLKKFQKFFNQLALNPIFEPFPYAPTSPEVNEPSSPEGLFMSASLNEFCKVEIFEPSTLTHQQYTIAPKDKTAIVTIKIPINLNKNFKDLKISLLGFEKVDAFA